MSPHCVFQTIRNALQSVITFRALSVLLLLCQLVSALSGPFVKRDATNCFLLSASDAQKLPGFDAIEGYADQQWGTGNRNIVTNDPGQPDSPATICVDDAFTAIQISATPSCQSTTQPLEATQSGSATGTYQAATSYGFAVVGNWTVDTASAIGASYTLDSMTIGIPEIDSFGTSGTNVSASITNTQGSTFSTTINSMSPCSFTVPAGQSSKFTYNSTICNAQGTGTVQYVATGTVWFEYISQVQGHYKWAVNIESVLPNVADRSGTLHFTGSLVNTSNSDFDETCS